MFFSVNVSKIVLLIVFDTKSKTVLVLPKVAKAIWILMIINKYGGYLNMEGQQNLK